MEGLSRLFVKMWAGGSLITKAYQTALSLASRQEGGARLALSPSFGLPSIRFGDTGCVPA